MIRDRPWTSVADKERARSGASENPPEVKPLYSVLVDSAKKYPNNVAIHYQGRDFTYAEVDDISSRFASAVLSLGMKRGDRVAILLGNVPQYVFTFFGTLKAGATVVNNNPLYKEGELEHQLNDSGAEAIVVSNSVV